MFWTRTITTVAIVAAVWRGARAETLQQSIDKLLSSKDAKGAVMGVRVIEAGTGRTIYSYHPDDVLSVASNAKVVTTAAALDLLGSQFELTTTLVARGSVRDGVLYGDLVIVGKGDPSMSTHWTADVMEPLRRFARETAGSGIRVVTGDVVANDLYFDREFWCPSWRDKQWNNWYQAPVGAIAFNDNCVDVTVAPGEGDGAPVLLAYYPVTGHVNIANAILTTTNKKKHGYTFARGKYDNNVTAKGFYYAKSEPSADNFTVYDPSLYMAAGLKRAMEQAGVQVRGTIRRMEAEEDPLLVGARVLAVNRIQLGEVIKYCNVNSQNLYAEMILKTLGREVVGDGSFRGGGLAIGKFLDKLGIRPGTYSAADGSGLSPETKYSARTMTDVLAYMYGGNEILTFRDSLPLAGYNGTMKDRLEEPEFRGKVRAKTGYIAGASGLSGYAMTANGKTLIFSMIFNNINGYRYSIKPLQDNICRVLVASSP